MKLIITENIRDKEEETEFHRFLTNQQITCRAFETMLDSLLIHILLNLSGIEIGVEKKIIEVLLNKS